jgi:hypothetical protein
LQHSASTNYTTACPLEKNIKIKKEDPEQDGLLEDKKSGKNWQKI